jgi:hypothetical protein
MAPAARSGRSSFDRRLRIVSPDDEVLGELDVTMKSPVHSFDGTVTVAEFVLDTRQSRVCTGRLKIKDWRLCRDC